MKKYLIDPQLSLIYNFHVTFASASITSRRNQPQSGKSLSVVETIFMYNTVRIFIKTAYNDNNKLNSTTRSLSMVATQDTFVWGIPQ